MPVLDPLLAELPAELDQLPVAIGGKVDQALQRALELDAHAVERRHRLEQLELGTAGGVTRLLVPIPVLGARGRPLGFVLGDPRLVFELWQERGELRDLGDDPAYTRELVVRLLD